MKKTRDRKHKPENYIDEYAYRTPLQSQSADDTISFSANRQILRPSQSNVTMAGGAEPGRTRRGGAITSGSPFMKCCNAGNYYFPQWGVSGAGIWSMLVGDIGTTWVAPFWCEVGDSFDKMRGRVNNASRSIHNAYIYELDEETFLPKTYLQTAGIMTWNGVGGDYTLDITFTAPCNLLGLGWKYVSRSDAFNPSVSSKQVGQCSPWPPGWDGTVTILSTILPFSIRSTGDATDVSTFSLVQAANLQQVQPLFGMRKV